MKNKNLTWGIFLALTVTSFALNMAGITGCSHNETDLPSSDDMPEAAAGTDTVPPTAEAAPEPLSQPSSQPSSTPETVTQTLASASSIIDTKTSAAPKHVHKKHRTPSAEPTEAPPVEPIAQATPEVPVVSPSPVAMPVMTSAPVPAPSPRQTQQVPPPIAEAIEEEPFYKKKSVLGIVLVLAVIGVMGFFRRKDHG